MERLCDLADERQRAIEQANVLEAGSIARSDALKKIASINDKLQESSSELLNFWPHMKEDADAIINPQQPQEPASPRPDILNFLQGRHTAERDELLMVVTMRAKKLSRGKPGYRKKMQDHLQMKDDRDYKRLEKRAYDLSEGHPEKWDGILSKADSITISAMVDELPFLK